MSRSGDVAGAVITLVFAGIILGGGCISKVGCGPGMGSNYASGTKTGVITKVAESGLIFTSNECELNLGGIRGGQSGGVRTWEFSTRSNKVVSDLQKALDSGETVEVQYRQYWIKPWSLDTSFVVERVIFKKPEHK